jgi:hypothetical protein
VEISEQTLYDINALIPQNYLWDGFWIDSFEDGELNISASFDKIYYRDIYIEFTGVTFFNIPAEWRDTDIATAHLMYKGDTSFFEYEHPEIVLTNKNLIDIYLYIPQSPTTKKRVTFNIVCDSIKVVKCDVGNSRYWGAYTDPLKGKEAYPIMSNRVGKVINSVSTKEE